MSSAAAASAAPAAGQIATRPRRNSNKPTPLDPSVVAACNAVEPGIKSPMTPSKRAKREPGPPRSAPPVPSPAAPAAPAAAAATPRTPTVTSPTTPSDTAMSPQQPSTSRQIPPNLNLSPTPTTPNPALRSPRPPIKSAHFDALEAEGERDAMVRTLVFQLQKEMQDEIDRLTATHRKSLEDKGAEFQALAELLSKKREEWSLQITAKATIIADQQEDIVGLLKKNNDATSRIRELEEQLTKQKAETEKYRQHLSEVMTPGSSKTIKKDNNSSESKSSNKDSDGFEKPFFTFRKVPKRPANES